MLYIQIEVIYFMFNRIILLIDDDIKVEETSIKNYLLRINALKKETDYEHYSFQFLYSPTIADAKKRLNSGQIVDVLVVDYQFLNETETGADFIKYVRSVVNRQCRIIFYTMQALDTIRREELKELLNSDVAGMVDKYDDNSRLARMIFEAAIAQSPIIVSLERFFDKYKDILGSYRYTVDKNEYTLYELIDHIRMDDAVGRIFTNKLLYKAIIKETDM